jgi:inorganic pyrophosphatase
MTEGIVYILSSRHPVIPSIHPMPFSRYRPHPWHGLECGADAPRVVNAYIEITPFDLVKYEVDKASGYLRVDRPQRTSSQPPALYGFIPQTYCATNVAKLAGVERGDGDPLDVCVLSERPITKSEIVMPARVIGGLQMIDRGEADDKIIAVLQGDYVWGDADDIDHVPPVLIERLQHYFSTYKLLPGESSTGRIAKTYGYAHAAAVIEAAMADYRDAYGGQ